MLGKEKVSLTRRVVDPRTGAASEKTETTALRIPDGYFVLDLGKAGLRACFIELENQTLTLSYTDDNPKDFAQKIRTKSHFYRSGRYAQLFEEANGSMWYLTITTGGSRRLQNLIKTTEQVIGPHNRALDRYWFTKKEHIPTWEDEFSTAVFEKIWKRAGRSENWSLDQEYVGKE